MLVASVLLVVGLGLLAVAADHFVLGAARLARLLQVSPVLIGAVVIGFGTSAPEALVSGLAAAQGDPDLGIGNVLGSDIANLALVLPIAALAAIVRVESSTLRRELPLSVGACVVFVALAWDGLSLVDGLVLAVLLVAALVLVVRWGRGSGDEELAAEVEEFLEEATHPGVREGVRALLGLIGTIVGAQLLVSGARDVADELGLADGFVGLSLVAIGTSLPELVTAVAAARRGEDQLIVGNLLGSNIFNSLGVAAVIGLVGHAPLVDPGVVHRGSVALALVLAGAWIAMWRHQRVDRWEATALLALYVATLPFVVIG